MKAKLGIDTGGTYTDAVLIGDDFEVLAAVKVETTHDDYSIAIKLALERIFANLQDEDVTIELVGVSTTLATNAIVETKAGTIANIIIGFDGNISKQLLKSPHFDKNSLVQVQGGHNAHGVLNRPLDEKALKDAVQKLKSKVSAFAITSEFAVRNPEHEIQAANIIKDHSDLPFTMSHELTAKLDGPKRALTTTINAGLIASVSRLLRSLSQVLESAKIDAPVMITKGDGSLMSAGVAQSRPIETILSGPAASVIGASRLSGLENAVVSDVGGTTTDIAILRNGRPKVDKSGARIGQVRTMIEAIEVTTTGLGGDSAFNAATGVIPPSLGPDRHIPLSLLATFWPDLNQHLKENLERGYTKAIDGLYGVLIDKNPEGLNKPQKELVAMLRDEPVSLEEIIERQHQGLAFNRLKKRGVIRVAGFTPSDAAHILDRQQTWDKNAALLGAGIELLKTGVDTYTDEDVQAFAKSVIETASALSAKAIIEKLCPEDVSFEPIFKNAWAQRALHLLKDGQQDLELCFKTGLPIVAVGGPAALFYPDAAKALSTQLILPKHYDCCNAIGAVSGDVERKMTLSIEAVSDGIYSVHLDGNQIVSENLEKLIEQTSNHLRHATHQSFLQSGGNDPTIKIIQNRKQAVLDETKTIVIAVEISAVARGRPAIGSS